MIKNKIVAITGGSGFLGKALLKKLGKQPAEIRCLGHSEKSMTDAQREFSDCHWIIGDILDPMSLRKLIGGADIVFHLAAQKHIPIGEAQPTYTAMVNINGTRNVMDEAVLSNVNAVIGISTDKACNPRNIYGMSKYFMERMFVEYNKEGKRCGWPTRFYTCRYGNVAASSGSVFEVWDKCGRDKKIFKITEPNMTRFYFTVEEAVKEVLEALRVKKLDGPYIPKMKAMRMGDALDVFMEHYDARKMEVIGNRGNEKIHEELIKGITSDKVERYTKEEIKQLLSHLGLLK